MPQIYATFSYFTAVYSVKGVEQAEVASFWLPHASRRLDGRLAQAFTVPFSDNNITARDLTVHLAYLGMLHRTRVQDDSGELESKLDRWIAALSSGTEAMITDSGDVLRAHGPANDAWSTTQGEKSVFDMRDAMEQRVDPDQIDRLGREDD